jgi:DNA replication and repair protein RecF
MQRNRLLRKGASAAELEAWEHQIAGHAGQIVQLRESFVAELNACLAEDEVLTESRLMLHMQTTGPADEKAWLQELRERRDEDARFGSLRRGPHCDRLRIEYQGREIRNAGSRGQQKLAAMALRLAEQQLRTRYRGVVPVLLLDDCLEALDEGRQKRLLVRLEKTGSQVLLTGPGVRQPAGVRIERFDLSAGGERRLLVPAYAEIEEAA